MKKTIIITTLFSLIIALVTSCSWGGSHMWDRFSDNDQKIANKKMEQILDAIKNRDESTIRKLFSEKSIVEADDLDGNIIELFDFFQGEVVSVNDWGGPGAEGGINEDGSGRNWKSLQSSIDVKTTVQTYRFAIKEFIQDTANPDNVGIYSLYIINAKDTDEQFAYWGDGKWTPGITFKSKQ